MEKSSSVEDVYMKMSMSSPPTRENSSPNRGESGRGPDEDDEDWTGQHRGSNLMGNFHRRFVLTDK